jgi:hypothetical protein
MRLSVLLEAQHGFFSLVKFSVRLVLSRAGATDSLLVCLESWRSYPRTVLAMLSSFQLDIRMRNQFRLRLHVYITGSTPANWDVNVWVACI